MKKIFLMMTVTLTLSLVSCNGNKDYKAEGKVLSEKLDAVTQSNDTTAALQTDAEIRNVEDRLIASGDTASLSAFREAMKDARIRNATFVTMSKINNGMDKQKALEELTQDALKGDINIHAVTAAISAILKVDEQQRAEAKAEKNEENPSRRY